ncbi:uncharacterized protein Dwil_GK13779 [Drosophila willistoni]|uniref:Uncharacterized protein n=1 Tax=Drosophila willistoni TaxID=7260 RepID=B4NIP4_DROWI|nr:uncharacterized protein Dwil_GK13779 [Drosophila willistoni]
MVILLVIQRTNCTLCVTKVIVRVPKEKDIGLIFDLTVTNKGEKKDIQEFVVTSDGTCTLNTTNGDQVRNVGRIFGGDFGAIQPGKTETISLVWPTVSLYNRVGTCPIIISTTNSQNELSHTLQLLHFDTRFETLDPEKHSLRKHRDFTDCNNWDKDYFHNCTPLNCEERYFGQRSFYNFKTEQCEQVTPCSSQDEYYDMYANECVDKNNFITEEELEQIRDGKFDNNYLELRGGILLLIIFQMALTCVTYIFICITIYGFLELVSKLKKPETFDGLSRKLTPRDTESQHSIVTSTSCMSQR